MPTPMRVSLLPTQNLDNTGAELRVHDSDSGIHRSSEKSGVSGIGNDSGNPWGQHWGQTRTEITT